jgi:two-component system sensor histidine kinase QseC
MLLLISGVIGLYVLCSVVVFVVVRRAVYQQFDAALISKTGALGTLLGVHEGGIELEFADEIMRSFEAGRRAEYFQVWVPAPQFGGGRRILERSPSLSAGQLPCRYGSVDEPEVWSLQLPDGRAGRAAGMEVPVDLSDDDEEALGDDDMDVADMPTAIVVVATGRETARRTLQATMLGLGLAGAILALGTAGLVTWSIRRGMEPVVALGRQVEQVDSERLAERFEPRDLPIELRPIAVGLNCLLERLEEAFERERRTAAVISHELRTPIAELRSATEVALKWDDDAALASETVRTAHDVARQMERIVHTLMRISRLDTGQIAPSQDLVPLRDCIESCLHPFEAHAAARELDVRLDIDPALHVRTDRDAFDVIVSNLLSNAVSHSPARGVIRCRADGDDATVMLEMTNSNESLTADDLSRLADPFWRKDRTSTESSHAGLGLAMVRAISSAVGIDVSFAVRDGEFVADVSMPRGQAPADAARRAAARALDETTSDA